ncbi:hypothetical protein [Morganella morganii IS15]|nr:hypothetical protein CSB69_0271 [Morganella morganii]CDK65149.1 hypothetical protein [Morganella morganii IS15]
MSLSDTGQNRSTFLTIPSVPSPVMVITKKLKQNIFSKLKGFYFSFKIGINPA